MGGPVVSVYQATIGIEIGFSFGIAHLITLALVAMVTITMATWTVLLWWRQRGVGPRIWPLLGASLEQFSNFPMMHDWLLAYFEHTKTFQVPMPTCTYTYTVDPANVEYILKTNFSNYPKGEAFHSNMEVLLGDGIFNTDGEAWKWQRKTASHEFNRKTLSDFSAVVFRDYALTLAYILHQNGLVLNQAVDMQDLFMRMTLDSICKVGFGVELHSLTPSLPDNPFARAFDAANEGVTLRFIDPLWRLKRLLYFPSEARLAKSVKVVDDFTYGVIRSRRSELQRCACSKGATSSSSRADLLSRFVSLSNNDDKRSFSDKTLRDMVLNFVIAGRDTTAATLSWFVYMLCLHPEVGDTIYAELCQLESPAKPPERGCNAFVNQPKGGLCEQMKFFAEYLTYEAVSKLPYLTAAITETIRLYPAVPQDPKGILADDVLPDGTKVKKGSMVTYVPYSMGRMQWLWGSDAREFRPERWLNLDGSFRKESDFKFTAFQAGHRVCLGKDSAFLQMRITAALLCRFFRFQLLPGHCVTYRMMAILSMAHGLSVTVTPRALS